MISPHRPTLPHQPKSGGGADPLPHRPTCPTTYIGGGSGGGAGTAGLTIIETATLHDGEPMHWWDWPGRGESAGVEPSLAGPPEEPAPHKLEEFRFSAESADVTEDRP